MGRTTEVTRASVAEVSGGAEVAGGAMEVGGGPNIEAAAEA